MRKAVKSQRSTAVSNLWNDVSFYRGDMLCHTARKLSFKKRAQLCVPIRFKISNTNKKV